jgi:hypothetical protein
METLSNDIKKVVIWLGWSIIVDFSVGKMKLSIKEESTVR